MFSSIVFFALFSVAFGQQVGTLEPEVHPKLPSQRCTAAGCVNLDTSIVLDANWRWLHSTSGATNCYTGNAFNAALCPNGVDCAANCALEGAKYAQTYGITTSGNALTLKFVTGANVGSRVYLLESGSDSKYQLFKLKNQEFTFDVDMSNLPCGINGALYMSEMAADGGSSKYPTNKAGAKYGTGYCDAQCPHDIKFINGEANSQGWTGSPSDPNSGTGKYGTCCSEMDIWEANRAATAYTPHSCTLTGRCEGLQCGDGADRYKGVCDKDGCDFNSFRQGNQTFMGQDKIVNTNKKFTVVTQFITNTGTAAGALSEIKRVYIQDGKVIANSVNTIPGIPAVNSITDNFCSAQKQVFGDPNDFAAKGGMAAMGKAYENGMVLALSIWDDHAANLLWLDSQYPLDKDPSLPGVSRGPCPRTSGVPKEVEAQFPNASVTFSNIKFGDIGTTFKSDGSQPPVSNPPVVSATSVPAVTSTTIPTTPTGTPGGATQWQQCGGRNHAGPFGCVAPFKCVFLGEYYSQCQ